MIRIEGCDLIVTGPTVGTEERHAFATPEEARARAAFVTEALSWIGTPFVDCGAVKGPNGAVDCANLLGRSAVDAGLLEAFTQPAYSPQMMLHSREELFVEWVRRLGGREVDSPRIGDVVLWRFGHSFSHGAVLINSEEVVHAFAVARRVLVSRLDEPLLRFLPVSFGAVPRPVRYFDVWG